MVTMLSDLRYGVRQIRNRPAFAGAAVTILALGVGATTAVFTLADPMLFRPLPYPDSEQLVTLRVSGEGTWLGLLQYDDFERIAAEHEGFAAVAAFIGVPGGQVDGTEGYTFAYAVTPGFLDTLRVRPLLGRAFLPGEYRPGGVGSEVALITYALWQAAFGGTPDAVGRTLEINGLESARYRIVGVLPRTFVFPNHVNQRPGALVPGVLDAARLSDPNARINPVARLRPGVSATAAAVEMQHIVTSVERDSPQFPQGRQVRLTPLQEALFDGVRLPLLLLLGATAGLLLLACANLACLCTARLRARRREFGIRAAIGASSWRMARQLVAELLVMAGLGGVAALVIAQWMFVRIMAGAPEVAHVYRLLPAQLDLRVVGFAALLVALALTLFGLVPAARAVRGSIQDSLQPGRSVTRRRGLRGDAFLIFVQTAVSISLLVTGALVVRSFLQLAWQPVGFEPEGLTAVFVEPHVPPGSELDVPAAMRTQRQVYERLRERLPVPVAVSMGIPGLHLPRTLGRPETPRPARRVLAQRVGGRFFEVFGITLESGRWFDEHEAFSNAPVAVLDRRAAEVLWPGEDSLGKQVRDDQDTLRTVVGVVGSIRPFLTSTDRPGNAFIPLGDRERFLDVVFDLTATQFSIDDVRAMIHEIDPNTNVSIRALHPFERSLEQPRFLAVLLGAIGLLTIVLTGLGIFGVVSHEVARRLGEVGVRLTLGATPRQIRWLVLRTALTPASLGVAAGLVVSLWWTETLRSLLFGLQPDDPATFAMTALFVLGLVGLASLRPAWRASRLDPLVALKR